MAKVKRKDHCRCQDIVPFVEYEPIQTTVSDISRGELFNSQSRYSDRKNQ